jgi:hypothetical protein
MACPKVEGPRRDKIWPGSIAAQSSLLTVLLVVIRCAVSFDEPSFGAQARHGKLLKNLEPPQ